jgi:hypothetical protein
MPWLGWCLSVCEYARYAAQDGVPHIFKAECLTIALSPRDLDLNDALGFRRAGWTRRQTCRQHTILCSYRRVKATQVSPLYKIVARACINTCIDLVLSTPRAYDVPLPKHATLQFLSVVDVAQLPIQILLGQQYNVSTTDCGAQNYFEHVLLACPPEEHEAWWNTTQPESTLGILVGVEVDKQTYNGRPRITELLLVASRAHASLGHRLPTPPASSPFEYGVDTRDEPTLHVLALAISSDLLLPANLPSPPLSPALDDGEPIPAIFLPQDLGILREIVHEPPTKKRKTAESSLDAAATRRIAARRGGGERVSAAAAPKPDHSHRRTSSNTNTPIQTRPLSRSPSLAGSRPGSVRGAHPLESKPSTLNRVQSLSGLPNGATLETTAEANIEIKNKDAIARVVMAGMRLYGLSQSNRKLRGKQQRSGSASPAQETATAVELEAERRTDEQYKAVYHQVYKGVCFAFRAHMQTMLLQGYTDALREAADKLLAMYCGDPLAQGLLGSADEKYTPGGRRAFGSVKAEEQTKSSFDVGRSAFSVAPI